MRPVSAWAAYRDGHLLYESARGTRGEVLRWCAVMLGLNKICTLESLNVEICKIKIIKG